MKRFGRRVLFRDLSLEVAGGRSLAVTGANGSGKSTLLKILAGVLSPGAGEISLQVSGEMVRPDGRPQHVGMVAPYLNLYDALSPRENLELVARLRGMRQYRGSIDRILYEVGLLERADERLVTFSSGMKQRMRLAAAGLADPPVLLLDEPSVTLDATGVEMVRSFVESALERGRVVVVATNVESEAMRCDELLMLGSAAASR